jgi:hypothetical protein
MHRLARAVVAGVAALQELVRGGKLRVDPGEICSAE